MSPFPWRRHDTIFRDTVAYCSDVGYLQLLSILAAVTWIISVLADDVITPVVSAAIVRSENWVGTAKSSSHPSKTSGTLDVVVFVSLASTCITIMKHNNYYYFKTCSLYFKWLYALNYNLPCCYHWTWNTLYLLAVVGVRCEGRRRAFHRVTL